MSRILFVGDLQLGAGQHYGTPERPRLADQAEAWNWIVEQASDHWAVDRIVLLGDVFDKRHPTPDEMLAFAAPLRRELSSFDNVLAIVGNHDVTSETAATSLEVFADLIDVHRTPAVWGTVATLPWTPPHRLAAAQGREQINERVAMHLVECARELRTWQGMSRSGLPGQAVPTVLALHWAISGGVTSTGIETVRLAEPILPLEELLDLGYRWIIGGHIHKAQVLTTPADGTNVIVAGSPMVSDFGEADGDHGVWLLDTDRGGFDFYDVPDRRFVTIALPFHELAAGREIDVDLTYTDVSDAVVRVRYTATPEQAAKVDHSAIERALYEAGAHKVYAIEPTILRERRARVETMDETDDPIASLLAWCDAQNEERAAESYARLRDYTAELLERA